MDKTLLRCCDVMLLALVGFLAVTPAQAARQLLQSTTCAATPEDALGPYYLPGVPKRLFKYQFCPPAQGFNFTNLTISGRVTSTKTSCKRNIAGAIIEIWQADNAGEYDVSPVDIKKAKCRGKIATDKAGKYSYVTLMPARYGGDCPRPAHIHLKVTAPGFKTLVTQMYFKGMNEGVCTCLGCDSAAQQTSLTAGGTKGSFDIVLQAA